MASPLAPTAHNGRNAFTYRQLPFRLPLRPRSRSGLPRSRASPFPRVPCGAASSAPPRCPHPPATSGASARHAVRRANGRSQIRGPTPWLALVTSALACGKRSSELGEPVPGNARTRVGDVDADMRGVKLGHDLDLAAFAGVVDGVAGEMHQHLHQGARVNLDRLRGRRPDEQRQLLRLGGAGHAHRGFADEYP